MIARRAARRRDALPLALPVIAAAVIGIGFALDRWAIDDGVTTLSIPTVATRSDSAPAPNATKPTQPSDSRFASLFDEGIAHLRAGEPDRAARTFEAARRLKPHVPALHANLGFALFAMGQIDAAVESFETAIDLRPAQANAYFGLAECREQQGDLEAALGAMRSFVHLAPENVSFRRRALSAIWEWEAALGRRPATNADTPKASSDARADGAGANLMRVRLGRLDSGTETLARHSGKTVVLNVWATWCPPCRAELPSLQRLAELLDPERFVVVGLSIDQDPDFVREFLRETGVKYPNYLDPDRSVAYGLLRIDSYPQTLVIAPDGQITRRIVGARVWDEPDSVAEIDGTQ